MDGQINIDDQSPTCSRSERINGFDLMRGPSSGGGPLLTSAESARELPPVNPCDPHRAQTQPRPLARCIRLDLGSGFATLRRDRAVSGRDNVE
jgi:hypothetical protein